MRNAGELERENEALRDRLSRLSQANLRINESLDFETVLQGVLDSACSLTGAHYGVITLLDESGRIQDFVTSGLTAEERQRFVELPEGLMLFEHLSRITGPLRLRDFHSHTRALGLPEFRPPMAVSPVLTFLAAPIRRLGESVGAIYVGEREVEFTPEDEETLVMFASQAALVIANARRHRQGRLPYHDSFRRRRWPRQAAVAIRIARAASAAGFDMRKPLCLSCADLLVSLFALGAVLLSSLVFRIVLVAFGVTVRGCARPQLVPAARACAQKETQLSLGLVAARRCQGHPHHLRLRGRRMQGRPPSCCGISPNPPKGCSRVGQTRNERQ